MHCLLLLFCQVVSHKSPVLSSWRHAQFALTRCGELAAPAKPAIVKSHCLSPSSWAGSSWGRLWLNKAAVRPVWLYCGSVALREFGHPTRKWKCHSCLLLWRASCFESCTTERGGWQWCSTGWHEESGKGELICKSPGINLSTCCCYCAFPSFSLSLA